MSEIANIEKLIKDKQCQFRDFRNLQLAESDNGLIIEGIACTFESPTVLYSFDGTDYYEVIDRNAFSQADTRDVIFNFNHCGRVYARTRNNSLSLEIKTDGLHMRACLNKDDEGHRQLYNDIQNGLIDKMSFAFSVSEDEYDKNTHTRRIKGISRLFDVSAVDIPAYDTTSISARSFFDSEREKELKEIEKREQELSLAKARFFYAQT